MREREPDVEKALSAGIGTIAFFAGVLTVEVYLLLGVTQEGVTLWQGFAVHAGVTLVAAVVAVVLRRHGHDDRLALLLAITVASMGAFGAAGCLAVAAGVTLRKSAARPFQEWYDALFPEEVVDISDRVYDRVKGQLDDESSVEPASFADIIRHGTLEEKQAVLSIAGKSFKPSFAPIVRLALQDETNAVRVQAATAIAIVETRFADKLVELTKDIAEGDPDGAKRLALARLYDDYAFTGLLDGEREARNRERAIEGYEAHLRRTPRDAKTKLALGRILLRSKRYEDASHWLESAIEDSGQKPELAIWYMESLFHLRRFEDLRRWAEHYAADFEKPESTFPMSAEGAVRLWADSPLGVSS